MRFLIRGELGLSASAKDTVSGYTKMSLQYSDRIRSAVDTVLGPLLDSRHDLAHTHIGSTGLADPARLPASHIDMYESIFESHTTVIANAALLSIEGQGRGIQRNLDWVNASDTNICGQTKAVLALRTAANGDIICRSAIG